MGQNSPDLQSWVRAQALGLTEGHGFETVYGVSTRGKGVKMNEREDLDDYFEGIDAQETDFRQGGSLRKPSGTMDQGRSDEND